MTRSVARSFCDSWASCFRHRRSRLLTATCLYKVTIFYCRLILEPDISIVSSSNVFNHILLSINKHSFFVRTVPEWNSLREACVDADTITAFQKQLHYAPWAVCTPPIVVIRESGLTIIVLELLELEINTVAMETVQLVLSQFKNFLAQWIQNWIRSLSLPKIMSERCELVTLCH